MGRLASVRALLTDEKGGEHGKRLAERDHYRLIFKTKEVQSIEDAEKVQKARGLLGDLLAAEMPAEKSWHKMENSDIPVFAENESIGTLPLSAHSSVVRNLGKNNQILLYCKPEDRLKAKTALRELNHEPGTNCRLIG